MPVNHKRKLAFVHIPKTAGVSICTALELEELAHRKASQYRKNYPSYTLFTVIRGAKDRMNSSSRYHKVKKDKIKDVFRSVKLQLKPIDYWIDVPCDYYLVFERVEKDLNNMLKELGQETIELERLNTSDAEDGDTEPADSEV